jgi:hypothetical protein
VAHTRRMPNEQLAILAVLLRLARRNLAGDVPYSPAWAADTMWLNQLQGEIRDLRTDLGLGVVPLRLV